ncbi:cytoplasmic tRNA 2-thiolation protein 2-like [Ornithodoros turicata]|uniref:cytoplasmic tRNA 2-thiolation protein 2-like n=1 Tax=Ornithodoros turicata TaxID=34597 RepID=UPI0031399819
MCSNSCDCDDTVATCIPDPISSSLSVCKTCDRKAKFVLRKHDPYCSGCFWKNCTHKFRSTLGKSRLIKHGDIVLVCFSGGPASSAMVELVLDGISDEPLKSLPIHPSLLYIDDSVVLGDSADHADVISLMKDTGRRYYTVPLELVYAEGPLCFDSKYNNDELRHTFTTTYNSFSTLTDREEFYRLTLRQLIVRVARDNGFKKVFTGETQTVLAARLLSNLALGRGAQIPDESAFLDSRDESVMILRPMREFSSKEVALFNFHTGVRHRVQKTPSTGCDPRASVARLTENFVNGLQVDFPSTVSTIWRTGDKLAAKECSDKTCKVCGSKLDCVNPPAASAVNALDLTRKLSRLTTGDTASEGTYDTMCYACRNLSEKVGSCGLPMSNVKAVDDQNTT